MEQISIENNIDSELCRLCGDDAIYGIFQHKFLINDFLLMISEALQCFVTGELKENDSNSKFLCETCTEELGQAYRFQLKVNCSEINENNQKSADNLVEHVNDDQQIDQHEIENNYNEDCIENELIEHEMGVYDENTLTDKHQFGCIEMIVSDMDEVEKCTESEKLPDVIETNDQLNPEEYMQSDLQKSSPPIIDSHREVIISKKTSRIPLSGGVASIINRVPSMPVIVTKKRKNSNVGMSPSKKLRHFDVNEIDTLADPTQIFTINSQKSENTKPTKGGESNRKNSVVIITKTAKQSIKSGRITEYNTNDIKDSSVSNNTGSKNTYKRLNQIEEDTLIRYQCTFCEKAFSTQYHLDLHNKKSHICQHCTAGFTKIQTLHAHVRSEHSTFPCTICDKKLSNSSNLKKHMKKIHGIQMANGISSLICIDFDQEEEQLMVSEKNLQSATTTTEVDDKLVEEENVFHYLVEEID